VLLDSGFAAFAAPRNDGESRRKSINVIPGTRAAREPGIQKRAPTLRLDSRNDTASGGAHAIEERRYFRFQVLRACGHASGQIGDVGKSFGAAAGGLFD